MLNTVTMNKQQLHDGQFSLKLYSKKLASGKCQVKFYVKAKGQKSLYGYTLVEAGDTLKNVVKTIIDKLIQNQSIGSHYHAHLFKLNKRPGSWSDFMIFEV